MLRHRSQTALQTIVRRPFTTEHETYVLEPSNKPVAICTAHADGRTECRCLTRDPAVYFDNNSPIICDVTQKADLLQSNSSDDLSTESVLLEVNETIGRLQWLRSACKIQIES